MKKQATIVDSCRANARRSLSQNAVDISRQVERRSLQTDRRYSATVTLSHAKLAACRREEKPGCSRHIGSRK